MDIATSYELKDGVYTFEFPDGTEYYPECSVILVDDNSGLISVKSTATRRTIFAVRKA